MLALMVSGLQGDLLNPCRCDGSVRHTHQHCLLKWISERGSWTCELCCYRFQVVAINMKRPWQVRSRGALTAPWRGSSERRDGAERPTGLSV